MYWGTARDSWRSLEFCRTSWILRQTGARPKIPSRRFNLLIFHYCLHVATSPCFWQIHVKVCVLQPNPRAMDLPKPSGKEFITQPAPGLVPHVSQITDPWWPFRCVSWLYDRANGHSTIEVVGMDWPEHPHVVPWDQYKSMAVKRDRVTLLQATGSWWDHIFPSNEDGKPPIWKIFGEDAFDQQHALSYPLLSFRPGVGRKAGLEYLWCQQVFTERLDLI